MSDHILVLEVDSSRVWGWGDNEHHQLGFLTQNYDSHSEAKPVLISELTNIKVVTRGTSHSLAVDGDGHVWCFGYNCHGQLGLGHQLRVTANPSKIDQLTNIKAVAAGHGHSLAFDTKYCLVMGSKQTWTTWLRSIQRITSVSSNQDQRFTADNFDSLR
jgi:alpha-tubulin suppressor-like RCC1 family protein